MAKGGSQEYILREIEPTDTVSALSLGDEQFAPLKAFLRTCAKRYHADHLAKTYVYVTSEYPNRIIAYITLICSQVSIDGGQPEVADYGYPDLPAIKIARLAVDRRHRGNDLATNLVSLATALAKEHVVPRIGCRFLVVDSKKDSIKFYEKCGFRLLDTEANKAQDAPVMFMDIGKLQGNV